ncbi:hypothetical protein [Limnoglobus roseus]|uniref:Uncharacterized protein n=1 Tax=Limnoglobus roseus TaxID=2598579 RepID=A0A5C1AIG1_9BACT|nr:hypothetical protein [Limnoglobus roseus]QEL16914.1 hypothetical protein PX52LOC_03890 [Limnoglobus roseus]
MAYRVRDDGSRANYKTYKAEDEFIFDSGVEYMLKGDKISDDPAQRAAYDPTVGIAVRPPTRKKITRIEATKEGQPPIIPYPGDSTDGRFKFVKGTLNVSSQVNLDGGSVVYTALAVFEFVERVLPDVYEGLVVTSPPFSLEAEQLSPEFLNSTVSLDNPLLETEPGPKRGEILGRRIDVSRPDWGLPETGGIWPVVEYWPSAIYATGAVAAEDSRTRPVLVPPASPPPPPGGGG